MKMSASGLTMESKLEESRSMISEASAARTQLSKDKVIQGNCPKMRDAWSKIKNTMRDQLGLGGVR